MSISIVYDVTHANIGTVPAGAKLALYTTGSSDIQATAEDLAAHPGCVRIDQSPSITTVDTEADDYDVENGAITVAEIPVVIKAAIAHFRAGTRPGQRFPAIYVNQSNVHAVANSLMAGGVTSGPGFHLANWSISETTAIGDILAAAGPFPIVGVQFKSGTTFDTNVFSDAWLNNVSRPPASAVVAQIPPGQWKDPGQWVWPHGAKLAGTGLDGNFHEWDYNSSNGEWSRVS
ncbi:MAG TPA: hypothetical protein VNB49_10505 [Candidatus Dormibacteraeota bacterium]|nr:hypothetical protein [Candidatus Dormibacteraeota bacterium]